MTAPTLPFPAQANQPETAHRAAALDRTSIRERVRTALAIRPRTDWELTWYLGLPDTAKPTVGKRREELGAVDTGERRQSPSGRACVVWGLR